MKKFGYLLISGFFIISLCHFKLSAQNIQGGTITYEQVIDYQLEGAHDDPRWDNYIADLPKTGKSFHILHFTTEQSFYEENSSKKESLSNDLIKAIKKANYDKMPKPKVKQIYYDFNNRKCVEQIEFMTRNFLVESSLEEKAWKLTGKKKKVLDFVCMGAELASETEVITAWFSPQIPISAGPNSYYGLPGIILGLEKNDEIFLLATSANFNMPEKSLSAQLKKAKKLDEDEFDKIVQEKLKEFKKVQMTKNKSARKSKN